MALLRSAALALCAASVIAGCGSGSGARHAAGRGQPVASLVCAGAGRAASGALALSPHVRVADADPANIECLISGRGVTADVVAQASAVAWTEYDTTYVHLAQAFGNSIHNPAQLPHPVPNMTGNATWVPAQGELIATNGTQSSGGSYVTVTVSGSRLLPRASSAVELASAVAKATLATAPRGGSPGPPPS